MSQVNDPRPDFLAALAWAVSRVDGLSPEQFATTTPCAGWAVRDVVRHMADVAGLINRQAASGNPVPVPAEVDDEGLRRVFDQAAAGLPPLLADDAVLTVEVTGPGGVQPGAEFLRLFTGEFLVHGWDVASVTGQDEEAPAAVAERALAYAHEHISAQGRNPKAFGPVVEAPSGAGPTRRLAAWLGR